MIRERAYGSARELVDSVFAAVRRHVGGDTRDDDQTVVAVLRRVKPRSGGKQLPKAR